MYQQVLSIGHLILIIVNESTYIHITWHWCWSLEREQEFSLSRCGEELVRFLGGGQRAFLLVQVCLVGLVGGAPAAESWNNQCERYPVCTDLCCLLVQWLGHYLWSWYTTEASNKWLAQYSNPPAQTGHIQQQHTLVMLETEQWYVS